MIHERDVHNDVLLLHGLVVLLDALAEGFHRHPAHETVGGVLLEADFRPPLDAGDALAVVVSVPHVRPSAQWHLHVFHLGDLRGFECPFDVPARIALGRRRERVLFALAERRAETEAEASELVLGLDGSTHRVQGFFELRLSRAVAVVANRERA